MTVFLADADVTLLHGDVLDVLRGFEAESVDCVVTSPPYWGLRDYGTGEWEGGDESCDHAAPRISGAIGTSTLGPPGQQGGEWHERTMSTTERQFRDVCGRCGARRVDQQIGLEPTPDLFVQSLVAVFAEVRRVLAPHGTCWVNLGDSYAHGAPSGTAGQWNGSSPLGQNRNAEASTTGQQAQGSTAVSGLKPKDLCGVPWRVAFALQQDGWWLRSDIVWAKPNPMPESVTDRPTKAHEYVFLLTKQPRYWFDQEAVREENSPGSVERFGILEGIGSTRKWNTDNNKRDGRTDGTKGTEGFRDHVPAGRNIRSVWTVATQPYPEAHFATYPEELVRRCVLAGCPVRVCRTCGKPSERIVDGVRIDTNGEVVTGAFATDAGKSASAGPRPSRHTTTLGWSDCGHNTWRPGRVLDPFVGSGTSCKVARDHGRHSVGIDLNAAYLELAAKRLQQQSLFSEPVSSPADGVV